MRRFIPIALGGLLLGRFAYRKVAEKSYSYRDKVVLITGGSRGLGLVMVRQLIAEGARVAVLARDADRLKSAATEFPSDSFYWVSCDVGKPTELKAAVPEVIEHYGKLDVVIHNAGVIHVGSYENMTATDYRRSLETHFWAAYNLIQCTRAELSQSKAPRILLIDSIGGKFGVPHLAPYSTGKFALAGFAQSIQPELSLKGIKLTIAYPSLMRTGSPYHGHFKGRFEEERFWFTLFDSLPIISIPADRAARIILNACRAGRVEVIPGIVGYIGTKASALSPGLFSHVMKLTERFLPRPRSGGRPGEEKMGFELPDDPRLEKAAVLTHLAAIRNNEL